MKRTFVLVFALGPATILWASSVHVDFDHGRSFSRYGRYAWAHTYGRPSSSSLFPNELMQERIVKFVEEALASRGLVRVDTAPDVLVNYEMTVTEEPQYTTYTDSIGPGWGWSNWGCCGWEGGWGAGWGSSVSTTTMQTIRLGT